MANRTLAEARTDVAQLIDDAAAMRWTTAQLDVGLGGALGRCLPRYVDAGGDRFDLETTGTTSASDGSLSLSGVVPLLIKQVALVESGVAYTLTPKNPLRRGYPDLVARDVRVLYVREYALPSTDSHPLVGVGASAANSFRAFDDWIVAEAAAQLLVKDNDARQRLEPHRAQCERAVMARTNTPGGYPIPRREWSFASRPLAWHVVQPSTLYLVRGQW